MKNPETNPEGAPAPEPLLQPRDFASYGDYWAAVAAAQEVDEVTRLQRRAGEATIAANEDPSRLTPDEHAAVDRLQAEAAEATTAANLRLISDRHPQA